MQHQGIGGFLKKIRARHFDPLKVVFYPYVRWQLPREVERPYTAHEAMDTVFNRFFGFIRPAQFKEEILGLALVAEAVRPKTVLEIGTSTGGTFFIWSRLAAKDALLISIDLPGGESDWAYPRWKEPFYKTFASKGQTIELIRGDSHSEAIVAQLKKVLGDRKVDFLFIDGDHSYEGVKKDYDLYSPFVQKGGIIAFHDIVEFPESTKVKVKDFWDEVKQGKSFKEFINDPRQDWGGIGVLFVQ